MAAVIQYKYTPDQMPVDELKQTFAARRGLLDHILNHMRQQAHAKNLSSFLLIGPRGAGKTTLVLMLCQCIREDAELAAAWLPLRFREEQFEVCSLRDLLAAAVRNLAEEGVAGAADWSSRVEQAMDDEESQSLAVAALRDIARSQGKRLVLFVENLNLLLSRAFDETSQATLRRLLMVDPFLMLVGTAVQMFEEVEGYDRALFNYFHPLHLEKLDDDQMCELLTRRAEFDGNTAFLEKLQEHRPNLRAVARVTGGNPRFMLMVYEILSEGGVTNAVQVLRRLVDQLTPILKHVLEGLPPQQAKILDALMRAGGTATPAALAQATRLKLNAVTSQLRRLKDNRMVDVLGGGKGQTAHYTVPDQLFCTWYQMRYLAHKRRRIELFVEVIRLWFEAEERLEHLQRLAGRAVAGDDRQARSLAEAAEYFTAALRDTPYEDSAKQHMIQIWLRAGQAVEAALALADLSSKPEGPQETADLSALLTFPGWCRDHDMLPEALETAGKAAEERPGDLQTQLAYAFCAEATKDVRLFRDQLTRCLVFPIPELDLRSLHLRSLLLWWRATANLVLGDDQAAKKDLDSMIEISGVHPKMLLVTLLTRVMVEWSLRDYAGVVADCSALIESGAVPAELLALPLASRAVARWKLDHSDGALTDLVAALLALPEMPHELQELLVTILRRVCGESGDLDITTYLVDEFAHLIELAPAEKRLQCVVKTAIFLARPDARVFWATSVRRMHESLPAETAEAIAFLLRVADILEGKGPAVLDSLPPQERAFALEVLERFEPKGGEKEK